MKVLVGMHALILLLCKCLALIGIFVQLRLDYSEQRSLLGGYAKLPRKPRANGSVQ